MRRIALGLACLLGLTGLAATGCAARVSEPGPRPPRRSVTSGAVSESSVVGVLPVRKGWTPDSIDTPRYAQDGRGFYYVLTWTKNGESDWREESFVFAASIDATPKIVSKTTRSLPADLAYYADDGDGASGAGEATTRSIGPSPDGRFVAHAILGSPSLFITDSTSGQRQVVRASTSGELSDSAAWVDARTLFVGVDDSTNHAAGLVLVDAPSGRARTVFEVPGTVDEPSVVDRIVQDPDGFIVFGVDAKLYRYDLATAQVTELGAVRGAWDYSPTTNRLLEGASEGNLLTERSLLQR